MPNNVTVSAAVRNGLVAYTSVSNPVYGYSVIPESVSYTWDQHGPSKASFSLRREAGRPWPDLTALTAIDIDIDGFRVWSGRISEAPQQTGDQNSISVQCEGWQYHLEDDLTTKLYVHSSLQDFSDLRSKSTAVLGLANAYAGGVVSNDNGAIVLQNPNDPGAAALNTGAHVGVVVDLGTGILAKRAVVTTQAYNNNAGILFYCRGTATPDGPGLGWTGSTDAVAGVGWALGPTTYAGNFGSGYRYVQLFTYYPGAATPVNPDLWYRILSCSIFGSTAWESGNASILKATDVLKDLLPLAPLLDQSTSLIQSTSFNIPELFVSTLSTPGEIMRAVNAYHNWLLQVNQYRQLVFAPQPTTPVMSIGLWSNAQIQDTSSGTSTDVYNKCRVTGTLADGSQNRQTRTIASPLLDPQGLIRTKNIDLSGPTTASAMIQLGDTFLASHATQPFKGSIVGKGTGAFRTPSTGTALPAYMVPTQTGQLVRLDHWIDPDTGSLGRNGRIAEATYTVDDDTVNISLDNTRSNFEAFLGRLQILTSTALNSN